ncbi:MAG TPA: hypothetical protein EYQ24_13505 [Bacteroidetes bacterium]|nr:hypothetical protein [Bacteroidota bacterium]
MRALTASAVALRLVAALVGLAALLTACGDAPDRVQTDSDATPPAPAVSDEPPVPSADTLVTDDVEGQPMSGEEVTAPAASEPGEVVTQTERPATSGPVSRPAPERPPMPAPPPSEPQSRRATAAADAFWSRFQRAVRTQDRAAIAAGLADRVRVGDQTFAKSSQEVQAVLTAIVEEEAAREAYLAVDGLTHGENGSTFSTTAHYTVEGEDYEVEVFGTVAEVSAGEWRLVEVGSR